MQPDRFDHLMNQKRLGRATPAELAELDEHLRQLPDAQAELDFQDFVQAVGEKLSDRHLRRKMTEWDAELEAAPPASKPAWKKWLLLLPVLLAGGWWFLAKPTPQPEPAEPEPASRIAPLPNLAPPSPVELPPPASGEQEQAKPPAQKPGSKKAGQPAPAFQAGVPSKFFADSAAAAAFVLAHLETNGSIFSHYMGGNRKRDSLSLALRQVEQAVEEKDLDDAIARVQALCQAYPQAERLPLLLAELYLKNQEFNRAAEFLEADLKSRHPFSDEVDWLLLLSYIGGLRKAEYERLSKEILAHSDHYAIQRVKDLLDKMNQ